MALSCDCHRGADALRKDGAPGVFSLLRRIFIVALATRPYAMTGAAQGADLTHVA